MKPTDVAMAPVNMLTFLLGAGAIVVAIVYGSCGPATGPRPAEVDVPLQDHVDQRIEDLRGHVDQRFDHVDQRIEDLSDHVDQRFDHVDQRIEDLSDHVDQRFDHVDQRFDRMDQRFEDLSGTVNERFDDLRDLIVESRE